MKKDVGLLFVICTSFALGGCATNKLDSQIDCRNILNEELVQKEVQADLATRFPNHKEAFVSGDGLLLHGEGVRYYPATVKTKENRTYSVIYNYSPKNEMCKKIGFQFIQLDPKP